MDTSKEYINQCEKAVEIQAIWENKEEGDFFNFNGESVHLDINQVFTTAFHPYTRQEKWRNPEKFKGSSNCFTWLPRQDQLQKMAFGDFDNPIMKLEEFVAFHRKWLWLDLVSMEQLWLAFVMKEKYGKTWCGDDWVKE